MNYKLKQYDIFAITLIIAAPIALLETCGIIKGIYKLWPIIPFTFGLGSTLIGIKYPKKDPIIFGIGIFVMLCSLFFFYLNFLSWGFLARLWPLFILMLGLSFIFSTIITKNSIVRLLGSIISFIGIGCTFVFTISYSLWPLTLALLGIIIVLINHLPNLLHKKEKRNE